MAGVRVWLMPYGRALGGAHPSGDLSPLHNFPQQLLTPESSTKGKTSATEAAGRTSRPNYGTGQTEIKQVHPQATPQTYHTRDYTVTHEPSPCVHAQTGFSLPQHMVGSPSLTPDQWLLSLSPGQSSGSS